MTSNCQHSVLLHQLSVLINEHYIQADLYCIALQKSEQSIATIDQHTEDNV